ncbi:hypothetical protein AB0J63_14120 [Streptosporangium canum]|uniref:hypothetical protein n=1 Tax=Streptosporangium canum TaxID=324952 RepID=UPI0034224B91
MNDSIDLAALVKIMATGLVGGAGLVALYALGLAGLSAAAGGTRPGHRRLLGWFLAGTCFLIVVMGVGLGLYALFEG